MSLLYKDPKDVKTTCKIKQERTNKMQELNYNVYYSYKVIDNYVWYNYILSYNINNLTYYLGSYNIKVNNYSQFINEVELNLLNCLNIKKKDIVTINPVFNLANL